jgi:signal transduction histidine kinase
MIKKDIINETFKYHWRFIFVFSVFLFLFAFFIACYSIGKKIENKEHCIINLETILPHNKLETYKKICYLTDCKSFYYNNNRLKNNNGFFLKTTTEKMNEYFLFQNKNFLIYFSSDGDLSLKLKNKEIYFEYELKKDVIFFLIFYGIFATVIFLVFIYTIMNIIEEEKKLTLLFQNKMRALVSNNSLVILTENIHHELNTPLEVIDNKVEKIYNAIEEYLSKVKNSKREIDKRLKNVLKDFDYIRLSSEQIHNILSKMRRYKHIKYSNGDKSLKDIYENAFIILSIGMGKIEYKIDKRLNCFSLVHDKLSNADLLGIVINNIKNSIEAGATKLLVLIVKYENGFLYVRLADNGNGIPKNLVNKIFEPNFSSKAKEGEIRGNGLFLAKQLLKQVQGDIYVADTSSFGTSMELKLPVQLKSDCFDKNPELKNEIDKLINVK